MNKCQPGQVVFPWMLSSDGEKIAFAKQSPEVMNDFVKSQTPLVVYFLKRFGRKITEENISDGLEGVWIAALRFNPEKGSFPNYARLWILQKVGQTWRENKKKAVSLDELMDSIDYLPISTASHEKTISDRELAKLALTKIEEKFGARCANIFLLRSQGLTYRAIGKQIGLSQERARQLIFAAQTWYVNKNERRKVKAPKV